MSLPDCMLPDGKTLIDFPQGSRTYSEGAHAAFEQCADIAIRALQR